MSNDLRTLTKAANLLFSDKDILDYRLHIKSLDKEILKKVFRKQAIRFHPDRCMSLGMSRDVLEEDFKQINGAYQNLMTAMMDGNIRIVPSSSKYHKHQKKTEKSHWSGFRKTPDQNQQRTGPNSGTGTDESRKYTYRENRHSQAGDFKTGRGIKDFYYTGKIPSRKFRFAEYLFYAGKVQWSHLIDSIVWQRKTRPRLGNIAEDFGYLNKAHILRIQTVRRKGETFGKTALRLGYLTEKQLRILLGRQLLYRQPIGLFFLEKKILSRLEIESLLDSHRYHNYRVSATKRR